VSHIIEPATSARAKCRGCGQRIEKGVFRIGERMPNAFGEGEMTLWFHLACAAYKRPQIFLETAPGTSGIENLPALEAEARRGLELARLPRVDAAQRAPSGRSHCRHCRELIEKDAWRIGLVFYEEGRFEPSGYIHVRCAREYFETTAIIDRISYFSPGLTEADVEEIRAELR
jgi:hypothetical protein